MRSYREYCAVARALDVVGDRWSLLIVRELALRGVCRYKDLQDGLPGISTNLLADRLRELEHAGVISKRDPEPPVATPVFELTEHGRALEPILRNLMSWGMRYMVDGPDDADAFFGRWMAWPAETFLVDHQPDAAPVSVTFEADGQVIRVSARDGQLAVAPDDERLADARVVGGARAVLGLIAGYLDLDHAVERGVSFQGSRDAVERLLPGHPPAETEGTQGDPDHGPDAAQDPGAGARARARPRRRI